MERRKSLHLAVSDACNNSCIFCLNRRIDGRIDGQTPRPPSLHEVKRRLETGYHDAGLREAWFTIAEPTLSPNLLPAVRFARELGYEVVGMNTNGRLLAK